MVRSANSAIDAGGLKADDVPPLLTALEKFDEIFAVLKDDDGPKMKQVFDWAPTEGREKDISAELQEAVQSGQLSDADIEKKIAEMQAARTARAFKASDARRADLTAAGIIIENTKDGVRWRRK
jgi:cysteinyl-tRNA synthetase